MKLKFILASMFLACSMQAQTIKQLQAEIVKLQSQVAALQSNKALALAPFVTVDPNPENGVAGPHITFSGANIHIVNGMGQTALVNGLGNLIIGYDELPLPNMGFNRGGSHDLVIGRWNNFYNTGFGNLVAGENDHAMGIGGFLVGYANTVNGKYNSVSGGVDNYAYGSYDSVSGGGNNWAGEVASSVTGGYANNINLAYSIILGGSQNTVLDYSGTYLITP